jgi:hypothetical protein
MADVQQSSNDKQKEVSAAGSVRKAAPKKQLVAVHDDEISLGAQLREADARQWGRDVNQLKTMATQENKHKELPGATADGKTALMR